MIAKLFDTDGKIIAYAEYSIVDVKGDFTKYGDYCFIFDTWVHSQFRSKRLLKKLLMQERNRFPYVTYIYWTRGKYKNKMSKYEIRRIIHGRKSTTTADSTACNAIND